MTIIVTGGAGFIGSNFIFHMLKAHPGWRIVCLDKLTYAGNLSTLVPVMDKPDFHFVRADICDRAAVGTLFAEEKPDIVVNFAAESHVDRSIEDPGIFLQTKLMSQIARVLICATQSPPQRFTPSFAGCRKQNSQTASSRQSAGIWTTPLVGGDRQRGVPKLLPQNVRGQIEKMTSYRL